MISTTTTTLLANGVRAISRQTLRRTGQMMVVRGRWIHASCSRPSHDNPLGIPPRHPNPAPTLPRRSKTGTPIKRKIPGVNKIVVVSSGKGGVGKSTVAVGLACAMSERGERGGRNEHGERNQQAEAGGQGGQTGHKRIGLLDLDIFGPSVPKLMGLEGVGEALLSDENKLVPLENHGIKTMSMGYLLPPSANNDSPVVWRGLMVMKAVQQLLFDVDWTSSAGDLDALVIDMPPGTGDVQLSLGQLVAVDGAVIVSTPQDVALIDARKGVNMFRKVHIPIIGSVLNQSHYTCSCCSTRHEIFGSSEGFKAVASDLSLDLLGEIPIVPAISTGGDKGVPVMVQTGAEGEETRQAMRNVARAVWKHLNMSS